MREGKEGRHKNRGEKGVERERVIFWAKQKILKMLHTLKLHCCAWPKEPAFNCDSERKSCSILLVLLRLFSFIRRFSEVTLSMCIFTDALIPAIFAEISVQYTRLLAWAGSTSVHRVTP